MQNRHFLVRTSFYQSLRLAISAEIHGKVYPVLGFRNHVANWRETNPDVSKMASSRRGGRKKLSLEPQTNKIMDYLSAKFDAPLIVTNVLKELTDRCNPAHCAERQILNELITNFETESSHHSDENVSEKTIKLWIKSIIGYQQKIQGLQK